jgi:hypothetical protein
MSHMYYHYLHIKKTYNMPIGKIGQIGAEGPNIGVLGAGGPKILKVVALFEIFTTFSL